jgi:hypothetical protein
MARYSNLDDALVVASIAAGCSVLLGLLEVFPLNDNNITL